MAFTYALGHFGANSFQSSCDNIQPRPGKKSVRYKLCSPLFKSIKSALPLSFHADIHHSDGSLLNKG